jgi:protein tyrosine phosphatase (PTP) superfamily phosphohydrolase (DUF442 family)
MAVFGIKDFGKVNEYLYRGAQPKQEGIEELKKLGIDTIVDLRGERQGLMEKERAHAESLWNAAGEHSRDGLDGASG